SGYSPGNSVLRRLFMPRESTPQPDCTAIYCRPSSMNDVGCPTTPEFVGASHSTLPVDASYARNIRSFVPPLKTRPPAVDSIGPQLADFGKVWVHTRSPVSTFHACTSPKWSAPGATKKP